MTESCDDGLQRRTVIGEGHDLNTEDWPAPIRAQRLVRGRQGRTMASMPTLSVKSCSHAIYY